MRFRYQRYRDYGLELTLQHATALAFYVTFLFPYEPAKRNPPEPATYHVVRSKLK